MYTHQEMSLIRPQYTVTNLKTELHLIELLDKCIETISFILHKVY